MALGAVLGAAIQTPATLTMTLTIDGISVLRQPGTSSGSLYGTLLDSIRVTEEGPGGVSSLECIIDDPINVLEIADGARVVLWHHQKDAPVFAGQVDVATKSELSVTGKQITITAVGDEARLDWGILTADVTLAAGTGAAAAIQAIVPACTGQGALNVAVSTDATGLSRITQPIAAMAGATLADALTLTAGTTLRECVRAILASAFPSQKAVNPNIDGMFATVDFYGGLRVLLMAPTVDDPALDFEGIAVDNTAGAIAGFPAADLVIERQAATVRAVYVKGGSAAGSRLVSDGSGKYGATARLEDATITTAAAAEAAGRAYLSQYAEQLSGSFVMEDRVWPSDTGTWARAGGLVGITDPILSPSLLLMQVMAIEKTFTVDAALLLETWTVSFGALPGSLASLLRALSPARPN